MGHWLLSLGIFTSSAALAGPPALAVLEANIKLFQNKKCFQAVIMPLQDARSGRDTPALGIPFMYDLEHLVERIKTDPTCFKKLKDYNNAVASEVAKFKTLALEYQKSGKANKVADTAGELFGVDFIFDTYTSQLCKMYYALVPRALALIHKGTAQCKAPLADATVQAAGKQSPGVCRAIKHFHDHVFPLMMDHRQLVSTEGLDLKASSFKKALDAHPLAGVTDSIKYANLITRYAPLLDNPALASDHRDFLMSRGDIQCGACFLCSDTPLCDKKENKCGKFEPEESNAPLCDDLVKNKTFFPYRLMSKSQCENAKGDKLIYTGRFFGPYSDHEKFPSGIDLTVMCKPSADGNAEERGTCLCPDGLPLGHGEDACGERDCHNMGAGFYAEGNADLFHHLSSKKECEGEKHPLTLFENKIVKCKESCDLSLKVEGLTEGERPKDHMHEMYFCKNIPEHRFEWCQNTEELKKLKDKAALDHFLEKPEQRSAFQVYGGASCSGGQGTVDMSLFLPEAGFGGAANLELASRGGVVGLVLKKSYGGLGNGFPLLALYDRTTDKEFGDFLSEANKFPHSLDFAKVFHPHDIIQLFKGNLPTAWSFVPGDQALRAGAYLDKTYLKPKGLKSVSLITAEDADRWRNIMPTMENPPERSWDRIVPIKIGFLFHPKDSEPATKKLMVCQCWLTSGHSERRIEKKHIYGEEIPGSATIIPAESWIHLGGKKGAFSNCEITAGSPYSEDETVANKFGPFRIPPDLAYPAKNEGDMSDTQTESETQSEEEQSTETETENH